MKQTNQNDYKEFEPDSHDDTNVLNYLLEHVRGLRPTSLVLEYVADKSDNE